MLKILISAYACEPHKGSEPGVGWNWVKQIAKFAEVWVITRKNNRAVIEEELKKNPEPNLHFEYVDLPNWLKFWKKGKRGYRLYYYLWQVFAYFKAKQLHKKVGFNISHHITFSPCFYFSFLAFLPIPFIWGPVGGVERYPKKFLAFFPFWAIISEMTRKAYIFLAFNIDPFLRLTLIKAKLILACDEDTKRFLQNKLKKKGINKPIIKLSQIGVYIDQINAVNNKDNKITFLSVGRLVPKKGTYILLNSFIRVAYKYPNIKYIICSNGPEKKRLIKLVRNANITEMVEFTGFVDGKELKSLYQCCDIFLMGSLQDSGGLVILEAMASGLPVICFDLGSPGEIITYECGIKISAMNLKQSIDDFARAMEELIIDCEKRRKLSNGALRRIKDVYHWDKKGEFIKQIYERVLGRKL
jgi:glycosyltransferase involved in cell wall biosynthesis